MRQVPRGCIRHLTPADLAFIAAALGVSGREVHSLNQLFDDPHSLDELLAESDHVVASVPLTEETRLMFNDATFARMRQTATFVNIARGAIVSRAGR